MNIQFYRTPLHRWHAGLVYRSLPDDPRVIGFYLRAYHRELWVEWRRA